MFGYAVAATLARLADEMVGVGVVLLVLDRTGSSTMAGAVVAGYTLPAVLTGPVLGAWLTRARRPRLALAGNELVLAVVAGALVVGTGRVPVVVLVLVSALAGASLPLTSGGFSSLVPRLFGQRLAVANTVDAATFNIAAIGGPALAGTLAATLNPAVAVGAIAVLATLAAGATLIMPTPTPVADNSSEKRALLSIARAGLSHLVRTPPLRAATLTSVLSYGCVGLLVVALPARMPLLGARTADAGYLWTAIEIGCGAGTLLLHAWSRRHTPTEPEVLTTSDREHRSLARASIRERRSRSESSLQSESRAVLSQQITWSSQPEAEASPAQIEALDKEQRSRLGDLLRGRAIRARQPRRAGQSRQPRPAVRPERPERIVFGSVAAYGLVMATWPLASTVPVAVVLAAIAGLATGPTLPSLFAARQRYSPDPLLAQVSTTAASMKIGAFAIASALGGPCLAWLGPSGVLLLVAAGQLVAATAGIATSRGHHQR